ncbi:hypothetical protein JYT11_00400 [Planctomycetaceae bacterium AH-315-I19]|nr:hypothetical protein [Planctomycetaceae bacterium AH-315-I19]
MPASDTKHGRDAIDMRLAAKLIAKLPTYHDGTPFVPNRDECWVIDGSKVWDVRLKWTQRDWAACYWSGDVFIRDTKFFATRTEAEQYLKGQQ